MCSLLKLGSARLCYLLHRRLDLGQDSRPPACSSRSALRSRDSSYVTVNASSGVYAVLTYVYVAVEGGSIVVAVL